MYLFKYIIILLIQNKIEIMAYFKINQPNQPPKWIKEIDRANGILEFSTDRKDCFQQDSGFFADSEFAYLKFHFTEAYPELEYMSIDTDWSSHYDIVQETPQMPNNEAQAPGRLHANHDIHEIAVNDDAFEDVLELDGVEHEAGDMDLPWR